MAIAAATLIYLAPICIESRLSPEEAAEHEARMAAQMKAAEPFNDSKPSDVTQVYWIYAVRKERDYPSPTAKSGKWVVFGGSGRIDGLWDKIKVATEKGMLGGRSKAATASPNPTAVDQSKRVICVYTYDSDDVGDVMRVRQSLRTLGVTEKIGYKTDEKTMAGAYASRGYTAEEIRKYLE